MSEKKILHQRDGVAIFEMDVRNVKGKAHGEVLVSVGPADILYSKLSVPKSPTEEDKYVAMLQIDEDQREFLLDKLAPMAVELAQLKGITLASPPKKPLSDKELKDRELNAARNILEDKLKRLDEPGAYKLNSNHRMAFFNKLEGSDEMDVSIQRIAIQGPDGKPLPKLMLTKGSIGVINFILKCTVNPATGKPAFPFQLEAVKVTEPVYYETQQRGQHDNFDHVESDYELPPEEDGE